MSAAKKTKVYQERITRQDVDDACVCLCLEGISPTTQEVRRVLGRGSFTTTSRFMKDWERGIKRAHPFVPLMIDMAANCHQRATDLTMKLHIASMKLSRAETLIKEVTGKEFESILPEDLL